MKLIIGLGNPGEKYENTRHNLGFLALDEYAKKHLGPEISWTMEEKFKAVVLKLGDNLLVKPQTHMNASGVTAALIRNYFKIPLESITIIHDDLDLPIGKIRIRLGGAAAGHHGVESVITSLGDDKFIRIRVGIGDVKSKLGEHHIQSFDAEKYVVEPFLGNQKSKLRHALKRVVLALDTLLEKGLEEAQTTFN